MKVLAGCRFDGWRRTGLLQSRGTRRPSCRVVRAEKGGEEALFLLRRLFDFRPFGGGGDRPMPSAAGPLRRLGTAGCGGLAADRFGVSRGSRAACFAAARLRTVFGVGARPGLPRCACALGWRFAGGCRQPRSAPRVTPAERPLTMRPPARRRLDRDIAGNAWLRRHHRRGVVAVHARPRFGSPEEVQDASKTENNAPRTANSSPSVRYAVPVLANRFLPSHLAGVARRPKISRDLKTTPPDARDELREFSMLLHNRTKGQMRRHHDQHHDPACFPATPSCSVRHAETGQTRTLT